MSWRLVVFSFSLFVAMLLLVTASTDAQIKTKEEQRELFAQVADDDKAVAVCARKARQEQIKQFGRPLPRISGHCWDGCPIRVVKPHYPEVARRLKISGEVLVDTIVDEEGNVVFARVAKGNGFFKQSALNAAYVSQYQPMITCDKRPIKFRWTIKYYFHPDM